MDNFLHESQNVGTVDSEGRFTLAGDQALAKLSEYTVRRPEQWVLKMVQAAVVGGAERLEITQSRREIHIRFPLADAPTPEEVEQAVFSPETLTIPFLHELAIGLRSLLRRRTFVVSWPSTSGHSSLRWNGAQLERGSAAAGEGIFEVMSTYAPSWFQAPTEQVDESRILQREAAYGAMPVMLDGREITVFDLPITSPSGGGANDSPMHLASGYLSDPLGEPETAVGTFLHRPLHASRPLVRWERAKEGVGSSFSLFGSGITREVWSDEPFRIVWTRHGVACAVHEIARAPLGGFLAVCGDHLRSDLSGLSLQIDAESRQEAFEKLSLLERPGRLAIEWLESFRQPTTLVDVAKVTGKAFGYIALAGLLFAVVAATHGELGAAGFPGCSSKASSQLTPEQHLEQLLAGLRDRLRRLVAFREKPLSHPRLAEDIDFDDFPKLG